jgi:hypothetical protein
MFKDNFRSNGTSGQNTEYHLVFVWISSASYKKLNVSILSTHDDNRCHVTIQLFDLISQYMSFSYVTRPLPVKWHFRSKQEISSFVRMAFPCYNQKTECCYLVYKSRLDSHTRLAVFAYARTCTSHTKPPSKMHYIHFVYLYWLSTRVRKRNVSILFKTIKNAAEVTST